MYKHGIKVEEKKTTYMRPLSTHYAVQVVWGTAPINMTKNPKAAVNRPILVQSYAEAIEKLGYINDWNYTLCQSIYASFRLFNVYPVIYINVLDPEKHSKESEETTYSVDNHQVILNVTGILLDSIRANQGTGEVTEKALVGKAIAGEQIGGPELVRDRDYILNFNDDGKVILTLLSTGAGYDLESIKVKFKYLDPGMVTEDDIIGSYNMETGVETGLELVRQIYPMYHLSPGLLLAPGWSQKPNIGAALQEKCTEINGVFRCECILDLDTSKIRKYNECGAEKENNGYTDPHAIVLWPEVLVNGQHMAFSAAYGAMTSYYTATNNDVPYIYPSNKLLNVDGAVLADGTIITLDQSQAAYLNGDGIVTAINDGGWRSWGNNTGCYPDNQDQKDRWIGCRRMFSYVANHFIQNYQKRLDESMNRRTIDDIINSFNIWGNSLADQGMCAGLRMEYDDSENDNESLLDGQVKVKIFLAPFPPLEHIQATEEFDISALQAAVLGGEE